MTASREDASEESDDGAAAPLSKHDGHPFEGDGAGEACALCGESASHILHHPTRIRAACALRGVDPAPFLARAKR